MAAPTPHEMERSGAGKPGADERCCGCWRVRPGRRMRSMAQRSEHVFYDSAKARRSPLGSLHYCLSCPGWSKATSTRVVYSRWVMVPFCSLPGFICSCGCCASATQTWEPMSQPPPSTSDSYCCNCQVPCGRQVDTFDSDIVVDVSAHQTLCQICRGEGDIVLYRKAGADLSDSSRTFVMPDVVLPFDVFSDLTFELSKINLSGATADTLGMRMGARVWDLDARANIGGRGQGQGTPWRGAEEIVHYDSQANTKWDVLHVG